MTDPLQQFEQQIKRHQPAPLGDELVDRLLSQSETESDDNDVPSRPFRSRMWASLAAAACLIITLSIWIANSNSGPINVTPPPPDSAGIEIASGWRINPTGDADFKVVNPSLIELNRGEIEVSWDGDSESASAFVIKTTEGKVTTNNATCFIGSHADQQKGTQMKSLTRVLVLTGTVMLTNPLGSISGGPNELLAATKADAPSKLTVQANSGFAVDLYNQLRKEKGNAGKNLFFSPYSISNALVMTMEGARGKTMKEMGSVLNFPETAVRTGSDAQRIPWETSKIHTGFSKLNDRFNRKNTPYKLAVANALWGQRDYPFAAAYVNRINDAHKTGGLFPMNFAGDPEGSRLHINGWVEDRTNNRIKDLIPKGEISSSTRLVLTNAIYFKGNWARPFDKKKTQVQEFKRTDGSKVKVPMMFRDDLTLRMSWAKIAKNSYVQLFELPYQGDDLSMVLISSSPGKPLSTVEKHLTAESLDQWLGKLTIDSDLYVKLPRFKLDSKYKLNETLQAMGMRSAFDSADFSGMTDSSNGFVISAVLHKGFIEVNEEGTEAAAATAVITKESAARSGFDGTRPFIYLIRDNKSGSILFMGRMMDPTAK